MESFGCPGGLCVRRVTALSANWLDFRVSTQAQVSVAAPACSEGYTSFSFPSGLPMQIREELGNNRFRMTYDFLRNFWTPGFSSQSRLTCCSLFRQML